MRRLKAAVLAMLMMLMPTAAAVADATMDAWRALDRGDYAVAEKLMKPLAERGETWAQVNLGLLYAQGLGVQEDTREAMKWFRMAAEQGDATAQHCLGMIYEEGRGISPDYEKAAKWYRLAADQGFSWAQHYLGLMYLRGQGVERDNIQAYLWLGLAAEAGHEDAGLAKQVLAECMAPEEVVQAEQLTREWLATHRN